MTRQLDQRSDAREERRGTQVLTFRLGDAEYGLDILSVQEIRGQAPITAVPNTPAYVKGVMNLRGAVIPVLDLGLRLGGSAVGEAPLAVTIVVRPQTAAVGLAVDSVSDVLTFTDSELQPPPDLGSNSVPFIRGVVHTADKLCLILDVERILSEEVTAAGEAA
jgi:purine-binding chemotaxis protein CheW